jgi:hypothetical protein
MAKVPAHEHVWYGISWDPSGKPVLWSCGFLWGCIKTVTLKRTGRSPKYKWVEPDNQEATPTTGLWDPDTLGFCRQLQDMRSANAEDS